MFTVSVTNDVSMFTDVAPTHMSHSDIPLSLGFIAAAVAAVFFGSNFVPVKKFETGDGMTQANGLIRFNHCLVIVLSYKLQTKYHIGNYHNV